MMKMTMTQKILAHAAGLDHVEAGQLITCKLNWLLENDITAPVAITEFEKAGLTSVFDPRKIIFVFDHSVPCKDIQSAELCAQARRFAQKHQIENLFDAGKMGIEHALLPEKGFVAPSEVILGGDSHTCTYGALGAFSTGIGSTDLAGAMAIGETWLKVPSAIKVVLTEKLPPFVSGKDVVLELIGRIGVDGALYKSLEFTGDGVASLSMDDRFTICNMAIEAGGKNGIFPVDETARDYLAKHVQREYTSYEADADAVYDYEVCIDLDKLEPTVSMPHLPSNTKTISEVKGLPVQQVVIGSCTNGRMQDLRQAAAIMKGKTVAPHVRCIVFPATPAIMLQAMEEGLIQTFIEAGCAVSTPTCGPCLGGHMGILAEGERAVATTNRNFVGRMGAKTSEVILASPTVAAATAIKGCLADPRELN